MIEMELRSEFTWDAGNRLPGLILTGEPGSLSGDVCEELHEKPFVNEIIVVTQGITLKKGKIKIFVESDSDPKRAVAQRIRHNGFSMAPYVGDKGLGVILIPNN